MQNSYYDAQDTQVNFLSEISKQKHYIQQLEQQTIVMTYFILK